MFSYDTKGIDPSGTFSPAPEGIYTLVIANASDEKDGEKRKTKNGDPYVNCACEIVGNEDWEGTRVYYNVNFLPPDKKGAGMSINFLKAIGEPWEGQIDVDPDQWVGKKFKAKLSVSKDNKGRPRNEIAYLVSDSLTEPGIDADEVPF